jgi:hypothetical protein
MNISLDPLARCAALLAAADIEATAQSLVPCHASGNNRTYRLETSAGAFAIKEYFRHEGDPRDRLATEFGFLQYAAKVAPGMAPAPLAIDSACGLALYEFIEGHSYKQVEITWTQVGSAVSFFNALNNPGAKEYARQLPPASEACFSINEHLNLVDSRLDRLRAIEVSSDEDHAAQTLIEQIYNLWLALNDQVLAAYRHAGHDPAALLETAQRCVSPSDFGFHNALSGPDGTPRFLDFEYAGWDDHAKMTGDFFAQLEVPVPLEFFARFVRATTEPFSRPDELVERSYLLRPVCQIKWCCIALNVFLSVNLSRRKFANPALDEAALKQAQLAKATRLFQSILSSDHGLH